MIPNTSSQDRVIAARPLRQRWFIWAAVAIAVIALLALAWPSVQRFAASGNSVSAERLSLAVVALGPLVRDIAADGKVVAANSPTLYAAAGGAAVMQVHAGDAVKRGQVLAVIDSPELAARLAQERSNADALRADVLRTQSEAVQQSAALQREWENAGIDLRTAQNDLDRQTQAFAAGAAPRMQVDHARDSVEKARLALDHAASARGMKIDSQRFDVLARQSALARQNLLVKDLLRQQADLSLRSPVDGQVGQLMVAERATVAKDAPLLSVIDLSALEVQMQVAESFARELAIGMPGEISGGGRQWKGLISAVSPEVVGNEVAARLRFEGATPDQLRQNQRLSVRVLLDKREGVLAVRRGSFVDEAGGRFAYVLRDGIATKVPVRLGVRSLDKVEVLEGLKAGDTVVISGADAFNGAAQVSVSR